MQSYLHQVNYTFTPYEKGHEHIHLRIFNQINSPKRIFSNHLGISYSVEFIANPNPKHVKQNGFYTYKKSFSQFSYYTNRTTYQTEHWNHYIALHGFNRSKQIRHLYIPISPEGSRTKKGRNIDFHNHYHFDDRLLHASKKKKTFLAPMN